ncbi:hypothetical protein [Pseudodesulfovibrio tunisiensis]|uniref:hypothetical protein n=1 Tax=Pseudodesulfovibrio tunisiensis TaxID=463192 RepID=UPI001FB1E159|nr:hypothetical protein [Pseudodesulfovibrio tunisiensis]
MTADPGKLEMKIREMYPEIDKHGIEMSVDFDNPKDCWIITFNKDGNVMSTHLERADANDCLDGKRCVYLGNQLSGFVDAYCLESGKCPARKPSC